jgi:cobyrinic acid a,c-diamide synthase
MITAPSSGNGKTTLTCALLQAFAARGLRPAAFKCGPDYIDPMFHEKVIGAAASNLDLFFSDAETVRRLLA